MVKKLSFLQNREHIFLKLQTSSFKVFIVYKMSCICRGYYNTILYTSLMFKAWLRPCYRSDVLENKYLVLIKTAFIQ